MEEIKEEKQEKREKDSKTPYLEPLTDPAQIAQAIEAILYAAGHPMRYDKLAELLGLSLKELKATVREMADHFAEQDTHHGIQLLLYPSTCQLATKERFAPYIREALGIRRGGNLSASSMEVLAVIAYSSQPATRSYIDLVRGVDSSYAVNSLLDKGLIEAAGRLDAPGRPMQYVTTDKFLRVFGLNSLEELPETEALSVAAAQVEESAEQISMEIPEDAVPAEYTEPVDTEETNVIFEEADLQDTSEKVSEEASDAPSDTASGKEEPQN